MMDGEITGSKALRLDYFLEVIDVKTYLKQNRDRPQPIKKVIPKGACFDRKGTLYIPWYQNLYRKQGNKKLILYRQSDHLRRTTSLLGRREDLENIAKDRVIEIAKEMRLG